MKLEYAYKGRSAIVNQPSRSDVAFATNTLRETTYFEGEMKRPLVFREGMAALYDVVVSDFRYRGRSRPEFEAWLAEQDRIFLQRLAVQAAEARGRMEELHGRLAELNVDREIARQPFYKARRLFFDHIYTNEYELWMLLDPVITVHPDELSFEAFSKDESSYARLAVKYDVFGNVGSFECGTTNIDFSAKLHGQLDRMRTYRQTHFGVDPGGFTVQTDDEIHREKKIDMPDSWVMGFLQVHSVMSMGLTRFRMGAVDLYNICRRLRMKKARTSPRSLRYELIPGERIRVVLEPWEDVIELKTTERYQGSKPQTIRTWGRDRLQTLERLLPAARSVDVYLAGLGLPSIYVVDLGEATFTLGLSGWTDNDWASDDGQFDLLNRPLEVSQPELEKVHGELKKIRYSKADALAMTTGLQVEKVRSALSYLCQTGRGMYDLAGGVFRHRELFAEPFTVKAAALQKAAEKKDSQAQRGRRLFEDGGIRITARRPVTAADGRRGYKLTGSAAGKGGRVRPLLEVDADGAIVTASCTCSFYKSHQLTKGPCEHVLALRLAHMERLAS